MAKSPPGLPRIFLPSSGIDGWRSLLGNPETQWRAGYSAMSAALAWERANGLPPEIARVFEIAGYSPTELLMALPEWKTPLPGGRRETQTDIFALVSTSRGVFAAGIEAKILESFGPTIGDWSLNAGAGKTLRLTAICKVLGVSYPPSPTLRYQLFHRTAAAVIEARRFGCAGAAMIVQSFSRDHRWLEDFAAFARLFDADVAPDRPAIARLPDGMPLLLGWAYCPLETLHPMGSPTAIADTDPLVDRDLTE